MLRIFMPCKSVAIVLTVLVAWSECLEMNFDLSADFIRRQASNALLSSGDRAAFGGRQKRHSPFDQFHHLFGFQVVDFSAPPTTGFAAATEEKKEKEKAKEEEIPARTRTQFTAPKIKDSKTRHEKYQSLAPVGDLSAAQFLVKEEPFFETFDHATAILGLNSFRRKRHLPFLKLLSIRPFFPFFVKT